MLTARNMEIMQKPSMVERKTHGLGLYKGLGSSFYSSTSSHKTSQKVTYTSDLQGQMKKESA